MKVKYLLFAFLFSSCLACNRDVLKLPDPREIEEAPEWIELLGIWNLKDSLSPQVGEEGPVPQNVLVRGDMKNDTRWSEMSVDFNISGDIRHSSAGFALNAQGTDNFGILRVSIGSLKAGLWKYNSYRPWTRINLKPMHQDHWYNLKIQEIIKKDDWRPWTITLTDSESDEVLLEQGIENALPLFGRGVTGLYAATGIYAKDDEITFRNFKLIYPSPPDEKALKLAPLFSDGMIMQRNMIVPVWGFAKASEPVRIEFDSQKFNTTSDNSGKWRIDLPLMNASTSLSMLVISSTDSIFIQDIAVGEVWIASGQSNMGMMVWQSDMNSIAGQAPPDDNLRIFLQPQWPSSEPVFDSGGKWEKAKPENVKEWSAVAYSFALELREKLNVPVGIIGSYWGGTSAESWLPHEILGTEPITKTILDEYLSAQAALEAGQPITNVHPFNVPDQSHAPGYLYNGMIYPHIPFAIQGVIWYQGESNALRGEQYETLFPMLIHSWRNAWNLPEMSFFFVQLAGYDGKQSGNELENAWPHIREGQRLTLKKVDHTGMAVAIDLGDVSNIHPYRKREVGERLSRLALHDVYGYESIIRCGPLFESVQFVRGNAIINFSETGSGLQVRDNTRIEGFVIAGADKQFSPALAKINPDEKSVRVWSYSVNNPVAVRYAWKNYPVEANLMNNAGLPASPFRTDDWPLY
ncbi:MAG: hypothetical protein J7L04_10395 [Bacteroidales bacterium]|nr:hypothetical protein [Bacteroidales bacterium]